MAKRKQIIRTPKDWQKDPKQVTTPFVQYWRNGVMITAQVTNEKAREMVKNGVAFVMTDQAIGAMIDGQMAS